MLMEALSPLSVYCREISLEYSIPSSTIYRNNYLVKVLPYHFQFEGDIT